MLALFPSASRVCSDLPVPGRSVAVLAREAPGAPPSLTWCDEACAGCRPVRFDDVVREP